MVQFFGPPCSVSQFPRPVFRATLSNPAFSILITRGPTYDIIYRSYALLKMVQFFGAPCIRIIVWINQYNFKCLLCSLSKQSVCCSSTLFFWLSLCQNGWIHHTLFTAWWELAATYAVYLRLIGKPVVNFLWVIIYLFSLCAFVLSQFTRLTDGQTDRCSWKKTSPA